MRDNPLLNRHNRRTLRSGKKQRARKRCMFYGLTQPVGFVFIDKKDCRCALISHEGRCKREKSGVAGDGKIVTSYSNLLN